MSVRLQLWLLWVGVNLVGSLLINKFDEVTQIGSIRFWTYMLGVLSTIIVTYALARRD